FFVRDDVAEELVDGEGEIGLLSIFRGDDAVKTFDQRFRRDGEFIGGDGTFVRGRVVLFIVSLQEVRFPAQGSTGYLLAKQLRPKGAQTGNVSDIIGVPSFG